MTGVADAADGRRDGAAARQPRDQPRGDRRSGDRRSGQTQRRLRLGRSHTGRGFALGSAAASLCLIAAACGGGGGGTGGGGDAGGSQTRQADGSAAPAGAVSGRPASGIAAAGGNPRSLGGARCDQPISQADGAGEQSTADQTAEPITIAYISGDSTVAGETGATSAAAEEPGLAVTAYISELNAGGGIGGRCIELVTHRWSAATPDASFAQLCEQLPPLQPLVVLSLNLPQRAFECLTLEAQIPTLGINTAMAGARFSAARGRLFVDQGSQEFLLASGVSVALAAGELTGADRVGLFNVSSGTTTLAIEQAGLEVAASVIAPPEFSDPTIVALEQQARLLEADLDASERQAANLFRQQLTPADTRRLQGMEQRFLEIADDFRDAGVTTVVTGAAWPDVRRLMRAAELRGWFPRWITNDSQPTVAVLTRAPARQVANLIQISAGRAAGDEIAELDRGCLSLRNTNTTSATFSHRFHTDAWNMLTSMCDYLDVTFGAISLIERAITREAFVEALAGMRYETALGALISYDRTDRFGSDRFRVLTADPDCVLNSWGCVRAVSGWLTPS